MTASQRRPVLRRNLGAALIAIGAILISTWAVSSGANASGLDGRVTICRATGHDDRPYERAEVSVRSLAGDSSNPGNLQGGPIWYAGAASFGVRWGDIVPPVADVYPDGVNWSEGSRVWGDDCRSGTPPTSGVPSTTGCTTTTTVPVTTSSAPPTTAAGSTTTNAATTVPVTTAPVTTAPVTTAPATTVPPPTITPSPTTVPVTTVPVTTAPATTAPGSSVLPPTVPTTTSTTVPATAGPASSVSPPGPLPTSGTNSLGLLLVGVLLVLLGLVLALTSAHA